MAKGNVDPKCEILDEERIQEEIDRRKGTSPQNVASVEHVNGLFIIF